ncbi:hypothetical protein H5410_040691 [Solanum commersonii]|uniref:Uncharacterized protein n=1 Tax=Solanum commersonii TaxID=4109 RepID=A0A9J5XPN9_SOLCO|nr:hypothetical protein H5410_040691 [Solanum commersonii]
MFFGEIHERHLGPPLLPLSMPYFSVVRGTASADRHCGRLVHPTEHWTSVSFEMANIAAPRESLEVRYLLWVPTLRSDGASARR